MWTIQLKAQMRYGLERLKLLSLLFKNKLFHSNRKITWTSKSSNWCFWATQESDSTILHQPTNKMCYLRQRISTWMFHMLGGCCFRCVKKSVKPRYVTSTDEHIYVHTHKHIYTHICIHARFTFFIVEFNAFLLL